nr:T9SS type A sorting domain-containing protein [uncultured Capnocytophaga sp.]
MLRYFFFFLCSTLSLYAQKEYCFAYDKAGNQRSVLLCLNGKDEITDEELFEEDKLPEALKENSASSKITLIGSPNPVTDDLAVYWHHSENGVLIRLAIFTLSGQLLREFDRIPVAEPYHIDVSTWSGGYYFLVATFSDGSKKVFKVVKR